MAANLWQSALARYPVIGPVSHLRKLSGSGFSGSLLWQVTAEAGEFALRRWPTEHPTRERLTFIHAFQRHLRQSGLTFVPVPLLSADRSSYVEEDGHLWELETWMPGEADRASPPAGNRLAAAMMALARMHLAAAEMPGQARNGRSPGLAARLEQLRELRMGGIERIEAAVANRRGAWDDAARRIITGFRQLSPQVEQILAEAVPIQGPLFPCLRDIWREHVLFTGDEVTGIIDFGAARIETPAGDIARLVGSFVGDNAGGRRAALAAYESMRPLDGIQRELIGVFDTSGVLLSGINWLTWLYLEQREFEDAGAVTRRLDEIGSRLERAGVRTNYFAASGGLPT